jgi:glycosyltransferase involved in cell wall biosynthesis
VTEGRAAPLVSAIIPVFNGERYVGDAIESVLAQHYEPVEIIVVDDGSTDGTARVLDRYGTAIRRLLQPNAGPAAARNRGIEAASGDLVAFLDADDIWPATKLARQVARLRRDPTLDVVLGRIKYVALEGTRLPNMPYEDAIEHTLASVHVGSGLYRMRAFDRVGGFDERLTLTEDHDWFLRARELGVRIRIMRDVTLEYRLHRNNMTRGHETRDFVMTRVLKNSLDRRRARGGPIEFRERWRDLDDGPDDFAPARVATLDVSVVIPLFDCFDYLEEALASATNQTYPPVEVIVVADGPTPDPAPLLERCPIPTVFATRPRGGPGAARNTGCALARGSVLAFLDADDVWLPEKLERQVATLDADPGLAMVFAGVEQFFSPELGRAGSPSRSARSDRAGLIPSAFAVRATEFARVGGFREGVIFGEFLDWYARAVDLGLRGKSVDATLVRRRVHQRNAGVQFPSARRDYVHVVKDLLDRRRSTRASVAQ